MTEPHDITVRKVKFEFPEELDNVLPGNDPVRETYLVAFSLTMPYLEPYLIRTFRSVADDITDAGLAADVKEFIGQEAQHFQNHRRINEIIKAQLGPTVAAELQAIEDRLDADYRRFNTSKSRRFNLAYVEGFEAMTCAMALTSIAEAEAGRSALPPGAWGRLWAWHLAEEMEHRTVAFELYEHLEGSYPYRVAGSLRAQAHFQRALDRLQRVLLASQGQPARPRVPYWFRAGRSRYLNTFKRSYSPGGIDPGPIPALILSQYAA
jgi:predicted metal-dependent hydrolase